MRDKWMQIKIVIDATMVPQLMNAVNLIYFDTANRSSTKKIHFCVAIANKGDSGQCDDNVY